MTTDTVHRAEYDHNTERVWRDLRTRGMTEETWSGLNAKPPSKMAMRYDAIVYAKFLATRDGKPVPTCEPDVVWGMAPMGKRPKIVVWRVRGEELLRIDIPNWDWHPRIKAAQS